MSTVIMTSLLYGSEPLVQEIGYQRSFDFSYNESYGDPSIEKKTIMEYSIELEQGDDKLIAECVELNGVIAVGNTPDEVMTNIRTTINEVLEIKGEPRKSFNLSVILKGFSV